MDNLRKLPPGLFTKTALFLFVLLLSYYFLILGPRLEFTENLNQTKKTLELHKTNLVQNRIAYIELTRLNPESAGFRLEAQNLTQTLRQTQKQGLEYASSHDSMPQIKGIDTDYTQILIETNDFYEEQEKFLDKITATQNYEEGLAILKSQESVTILTRQTNLIRQYQLWLNEIEQLK